MKWADWAAFGMAWAMAVVAVLFLGKLTGCEYQPQRWVRPGVGGGDVDLSTWQKHGTPVHSSREQHPDDLNVWGAQVSRGAEMDPYIASVTGQPPMGEGGQWHRRSMTVNISAWFYEKTPEDQVKAEAFLWCVAKYGFDRAANQARVEDCR